MSASQRDVLPAFLKHTGQQFLDTIVPEISPSTHRELERWYSSTEGQGALTAFLLTLWGKMAGQSVNAMPAHDARHAMLKVPATSLEYMAAENVDGWGRVGILGALLHDFGRWAEERIFGEPCDSMVHARLSYLLGNELLTSLEIPTLIKQHILLAAIRHTAGARPSDPLPLKLTVAADRDQLYGPEIVLRLAHHGVNDAGDLGSFYGEKPGIPILDKLEHFLCNRLSGPLYSRQMHVDHLWGILATFLLLAEDADASRVRFARVRACPDAVPPLRRPFIWEQEWGIAQDMRPPTTGPASALVRLLQAPHLAPGKQHIQVALGKLSRLSPERAPYLGRALSFVDEQRWAQDARQYAALELIQRDSSTDLLVRTLAHTLMTNWSGLPQSS